MQNFFTFSNIFLQEIENSNNKIIKFTDVLRSTQSLFAKQTISNSAEASSPPKKSAQPKANLDINFLCLQNMLHPQSVFKKKDDSSTTHGNSSQSDGERQLLRSTDQPQSFIAKRRRCTKTVTTCPHTDAKHYAKVFIILRRVCVVIAITVKEEIKKLGTASTMRRCSTLEACARSVTRLVIMKTR